MKDLYVLVLVICAMSCQQVQPTVNGQKDENKVDIPFLPKKASKVDDPYFVQTTAVFSKEGPQSITRNMIQDKDGKMWFATWEGVMSYDGQQFTNHTNKDSLRRFHMFSVHQDKNNDYWFGSVRGGLYRYDGKIWQNITKADGLTHDIVSCFMEDSRGVFWIGTAAGLVQYDGATYKPLMQGSVEFAGDVNDVVEDKDGRLWIGTRDALYIYENGTTKKYEGINGESLYNVRTIIKDQQDRMWFGGNDGLWVIDGDRTIQLMDDFVGFVYQDPEGTVYASVANGAGRNWTLNRFDVRYTSLEELIPEQLLEQEGQLFGLLKDRNGILWYAHERGVSQFTE